MPMWFRHKGRELRLCTTQVLGDQASASLIGIYGVNTTSLAGVDGLACDAIGRPFRFNGSMLSAIELRALAI